MIFRLTKTMGLDELLSYIAAVQTKYPMGARIEVKPIKPVRSLPQNSRHWALCGLLANAVGDTKEEVHNDVLCEYHGYTIKQDRFGMAKRVPNGRSKKLTREDFAQMEIILERWLSLAGVAWEEAA